MSYWVRAASPFVLAAMALSHRPKPMHGPIEYAVLVTSENEREARVTCECGSECFGTWGTDVETFLQLLTETWSRSGCVL